MQTIKSNFFIHIMGLSAITLCAIFAYQGTLLWMLDRYLAADSYYSHGFLVPFVSLFFIFQHKKEILKTEQSSNALGLVLIVLALGFHILGTILYIFSISGFSIFLFITGLSIFLFGGDISKRIWFPICFLLFMFPLPEAVISMISFPLKMFAAKAGVWSVRLIGVPVHGEGFNIFIPAGQLLVGNPCSGLRSLIAFLAMGSLFAYLSPVGTVKKWVIFLASIPFALLSNVIRIVILVLVSHYWGLEAASPETLVHSGSGLLIFAIGFSLLFLTTKVLEWRR